MKLVCAKDYEDASYIAAKNIYTQMIKKADSVLGLATGSSPVGVYKQLIKWYKIGDLDFSDVTTINLDEYRGINRTDEQSYYFFMQRNLFKHVNIKPSNTYIPNGMEEDCQKACNDYDAIIKKVGRIDLQLLGLGENGHIGFNEPSEAFTGKTHCVDLADSTLLANARFFKSLKDVPKQAYTLGVESIMMAKKIIVIVSGEKKADILKKVLYGPITPLIPASILQVHPDVVIVADEAARSAL